MLTIQKLPLCAKGAPVAITLENSNYMRVTLLSYGATLQSIVVPDQNGALTDVLLGYESVKNMKKTAAISVRASAETETASQTQPSR